MITATVTGLPDLKAALAGIAPKLRVRALANALRAGAREVQKAARSKAPVINSTAPAVRKGYRKPGTVRQAISVRTSKIARRRGDVGVFVNVRPAKGGKRGSKSPHDPYYWRWVEFGTQPHSKGSRSSYLSSGKLRTRRHKVSTGSTPAFRFLQYGATRLSAALAIFRQTIGPAIAKLNKPKAPAP